MSVWQPIETAPKDRWILLGFFTPVEDGYEDMPSIAMWDGGGWSDGGEYYSASCRMQPTHWAEIPKFDGEP